MKQAINLTEDFEEKVSVIADEVLNILKKLSQENNKQINSKLIAERMVWSDSLKNVLTSEAKKASINDPGTEQRKAMSNMILNKLNEILPSHISESFNELRDHVQKNESAKNSEEWLNSPIEIIKKHLNSMSNRITELDSFMKQTMNCLSETEMHIDNALSSQQENSRLDKSISAHIDSNMNSIKHDITDSCDFGTIKMKLLEKFENINKGLLQKQELDMKRLNETEMRLKEMSSRMTEIKQEADEIKRKSYEMVIESTRDGLTGLFNRRAYDQKMQEILANFKRYGTPASLMICDIDFFKKINDNFGHIVGDLALKKLADLLTERLRINDFISRYGGEEFAIILTHTKMNGAMTAAESIRNYIDNALFSYKDQKIVLTISIGISEFNKEDDINSVFERADNALYIAKRSGRNNVKTEKDVTTDNSSINNGVLSS
jgi:diguanylate cyclase (GGDEF)-like protein